MDEKQKKYCETVAADAARYTKAERKILERTLNRVKKCSGDCKHCEKCHFYSASADRAIYYAFGCDALPQEHFTCISDSMSQLHAAAVETLEFELS